MKPLAFRLDEKHHRFIEAEAKKSNTSGADIVRRALDCYSDYLFMQGSSSFINKEVSAEFDKRVYLLEQKLNARSNKLLSQLAIQQSMLVMAITDNLELSSEDLKRYREGSIEMLKTIDGIFTMERALDNN